MGEVRICLADRTPRRVFGLRTSIPARRVLVSLETLLPSRVLEWMSAWQRKLAMPLLTELKAKIGVQVL